MKDIKFPDKHEYVFEREMIKFPAFVDGDLVVCRITLEEMMREFGCGTPDTFEEEFGRLRPQIEERAKRIIESEADEMRQRGIGSRE